MRIFFYLMPAGPYTRPAYQFQLIYLAQGLRARGIPFGANIDYWQQPGGTTLFQQDTPIQPESCDVMVISSLWHDYGLAFPAVFNQPSHPALRVLIDTSDLLFTVTHQPQARHFDLILKQRNTRMHYPSHARTSWAFGLAEEVVTYLQQVPAYQERQPVILANYRHRHIFREMADQQLIPGLGPSLVPDRTQEKLDEPMAAPDRQGPHERLLLLQQQSGGRHQFAYLDRLKAARACSTFGGGLVPQAFFLQSPQRYKLATYLYDGMDQSRIRNLLKRLGLVRRHTYANYQWDSWRLWESLAAGCLTFHVDFERYGIDLPVMPVNWTHYIGVDFQHIDRDLERFHALGVEGQAQIAAAGRTWALQHYAPPAVADRFLAIISQHTHEKSAGWAAQST